MWRRVNAVLTVAGVLAVLFGLGAAALRAEDRGDTKAAGRNSHSDLAGQLIDASGFRAGLCVHVGCDDSRLTAELSGGGRFVVHGLSPDRGEVENARRYIHSRSLYGRVSVDQFIPPRLPYVDNLVNVVVVDDLAALLKQGVSLKEVMRVLCPGGVVFLGRRDGAGDGTLTEKKLKDALAGAGLADVDIIKSGGLWARVRKTWPDNPGPDGPPSRVQWMAGPLWTRGHFSTLNWRSEGGRLFYFFDEAPTQVEGPPQVFLTARDAFNGLLLWKRAMPGTWQYPALLRASGKLCPSGDRVYAVLEEDGPLVALDAATGSTLKTYEQRPGTISMYKGMLILGGGGPVRSLDPSTGEVLWQSEVNGAFTLGGDQVYCQTRSSLVRLSAATGEVVWQQEPGWGEKKPTLRCCYEEILLFAESNGPDAGAVYVVSALDGKYLWSKQYNTPPKGYGRDPLAAGGLVWIHIREDQEAGVGWLGLDLLTGDVRRRIDYPPDMAGKVRQRCFQNSIVGRFLVTGKDPVFVDWESGEIHVAKMARGTCRGGGFLGANGLVYTGPHQCHCFPMLRGFVTLAPRDDIDSGVEESRKAPRLEEGPMFGAETGHRTDATADDWPCYRHDALRSGRTATSVPADPEVLWRKAVGGQVSSPVIAEGRLLLASMDTHRVMAFDASGGDALWEFTAGGPIDTPPTVFRGLCLFGSRDGWVYCLQASTGELIWRFRAAPEDRRIVVNGRLESPWPVHGSVVIQGDMAFFAAGRDARVDGGITVYAADPSTGRILWQKRPEGDIVSDLLVSDGKSVCLPALRFDTLTGETSEVDSWKPTQLRGGRGGLLDDSLAIREGSWSSPLVGGRLLVLDGRNDPQLTNNAAWSGPRADGQVQVFDTRRAYAISTAVRGDNVVKQGQDEWTITAQDDRRGPPAWKITVPIRPRAMLLADKTLFLAGTPDVADPEHPWAAISGRKGALLWAISAGDGGKMSEMKLDVPPVWDGLAAAGGRLYISLSDGTVLCLGKRGKD